MLGWMVVEVRTQGVACILLVALRPPLQELRERHLSVPVVIHVLEDLLNLS